jgi:hypothetical protein
MYMNKKMIIVLGGVVILGIFVFLVLQYWPAKDSTGTQGSDEKNTTYQIDGQMIVMKDGVFHFVAGDDTAPRATVKYFGNSVEGDFNGDGLADQAFILTEDNGGSGTFYYVVAALKTADGYKGTNGILLGDRIAPQTTEFKDGQIIVNYADRKPSEPFTTQPSVGVSKYLKISGESLVEVSK